MYGISMEGLLYLVAGLGSFAAVSCLLTCLSSSFQTSPPSLHGLVSLSVLGCWCNDLTLVQAALQEITKIIGKPLAHKSFTS